jgi:predicted Zn-dependent protease
MSEQSKDNLGRKDWLQNQTAGNEIEKVSPQEKTEGDWDAIARRGRSILDSEAEAEDMLRELDDAIDQRFDSAAPPRRKIGGPKPFRWLAIAAGFFLLIAAGWWIFSGGDRHLQLYEEYFVHLDNELTVSLMGDTAEDPLRRAMRPYNARRYPEAAERIGEYLRGNEEEPPGLRLYYGISLLESGALDEAIDQLQQQVVMPPADSYSRTAEWYLALAYLRSGQTDSARLLLAEMTQAQHPYAAKARTLLNEL